MPSNNASKSRTRSQISPNSLVNNSTPSSTPRRSSRVQQSNCGDNVQTVETSDKRRGIPKSGKTAIFKTPKRSDERQNALRKHLRKSGQPINQSRPMLFDLEEEDQNMDETKKDNDAASDDVPVAVPDVVLPDMVVSDIVLPDVVPDAQPKSETEKVPPRLMDYPKLSRFVDTVELQKCVDNYIANKNPETKERMVLAFKTQVEAMDDLLKEHIVRHKFYWVGDIPAEVGWDESDIGEENRDKLMPSLELSVLQVSLMFVSTLSREMNNDIYWNAKPKPKHSNIEKLWIERAPKYCYDIAFDHRYISLQDILECREEHKELLKDGIAAFKQFETPRRFQEMLNSMNKTLELILRTTDFSTSKIWKDLFAFQRGEYCPKGVMYRRFIFNIANCFEYDLLEQKWIGRNLRMNEIWYEIQFDKDNVCDRKLYAEQVRRHKALKKYNLNRKYVQIRRRRL